MTGAAVRRAEDGSAAWRSVVHALQANPADHTDLYSLAGELVDTLATVSSLARLLARQVGRYPAAVAAAGALLYDDSRDTQTPVAPGERLAAAVIELERMAAAASTATGAANGFWSAIGHIGTEEHTPVTTQPTEHTGNRAGDQHTDGGDRDG